MLGSLYFCSNFKNRKKLTDKCTEVRFASLDFLRNQLILRLKTKILITILPIDGTTNAFSEKYFFLSFKKEM